MTFQFSTNTDVRDFNPEQQDALLAEMQAGALKTFQRSHTPGADWQWAANMFARATEARAALSPVLAEWRRYEAMTSAMQSRGPAG